MNIGTRIAPDILLFTSRFDYFEPVWLLFVMSLSASILLSIWLRKWGVSPSLEVFSICLFYLLPSEGEDSRLLSRSEDWIEFLEMPYWTSLSFYLNTDCIGVIFSRGLFSVKLMVSL